MKRFFFLAGAIAFIGLAIYWFRRDSDPADTSDAISSAVVEATVKPIRPTSKPKTVRMVRMRKPELPEPQPSDIVTFEIKDGLGIVQNDIIIGIPEEGTEDTGFYKLPIPNYWDKPEIPYAIDADVPRPEEVDAALKHIEKKTGVKFIPYENQPDAILFQKGKEHCRSMLGRQGGLQPIQVSETCGWHEVTHEILHALGFIHEHSRFDRNDYISVVWKNVDEKFRLQFEIFSEELMGPSKGTAFDYRSIMMYEKNFFAKEKGLETLRSRTTESISPGKGLSQIDVDRIKKMFRLD